MSDATPDRILIVDDDCVMRITIKTTLRAVGRFVVEDAADGADALGKPAGFRAILPRSWPIRTPGYRRFQPSPTSCNPAPLA